MESIKKILALVTESFEEAGALVWPVLSRKIPAKFRSYVLPACGILFLISVGWAGFSLFGGRAYSSLYRTFLKNAAIFHTFINFFSFLVIFSPIILALVSVWLHTIRAKNGEETRINAEQNWTTYIVMPRQEEKTDWMKSYPEFWNSIHAPFSVSENDYLLNKSLSHASFEFNRFSPWAKTQLPGFFAAFGVPSREIAQTITYRLRSIHNDCQIQRQERDIFEGLKNGDSVLMYADFSPAADPIRMIDVAYEKNHLSGLFALLGNTPKSVLSAGLHLLVRDALNALEDIEEYIQSQTTTPEGKKRPLNSRTKAQISRLEQKAACASASNGFDVIVRLYVVAKDQESAKSLMQRMEEWLKSTKGANGYLKINEGSDWETLQTRRYIKKKAFNNLCAMEMTTLWHFPDASEKAPLARNTFKMLPPNAEVILQENELARVFGNAYTSDGEPLPIGLNQYSKNPDIFYHSYGVGPTGVGKSVSIINMIYHDLAFRHPETGKPMSIVVLEPHNDLTNDVMKRIPAEREKDVVVLDPMDGWPFGLNMMETSGKEQDIESDSARVMGAFSKAMGSLFEQAPRAKRYISDAVRAIMVTLPRNGIIPTIIHLRAFISSVAYREYVVSMLQPEDAGGLVNEWNNFLARTETQQNSELDSANTRIRAFVENQVVRRVLAQPGMSFNMKQLLDNGAIILAKMHNDMGAANRALIGALIVSSVFKSVMTRTKIPIEQRPFTSFYIDEFQTMVAGSGEDIKAILAEARKARLAMMFANQYFEQLPPDIQSAIMQNCGTKIVFRQGLEGAKLFVPLFSGLTTSDFMTMPRYVAHISMMRFGTPYSVTVQLNPEPPVVKENFNRTKTLNDLHNLLLSKNRIRIPPANFSDFEKLDTKTAAAWYCVHWTNLQQPENSDMYMKFVRWLSSPEEKSDEFKKWRIDWAYQEREALLQDASFLPEKTTRLAHLSRLAYGTPAAEIDALVRNVNAKIQALTREREAKKAEQDAERKTGRAVSRPSASGITINKRVQDAFNSIEEIEDLFG